MIIEKVSEVRDYINDPRKKFKLFQNKNKWRQLCASMDVIQDTQLAIDSYFKLGKFDAYSGGYLYLYGLLQAFFMQQDAVSSLNCSLFQIKPNFKNDFPELYNIRELRNDAIGHPTDRGGESYHYITRGSINNVGFELSSLSEKDGRVNRVVQLEDIRKQQESITLEMLDKVIKELEKEFKEKKKQFKGKKITDLISSMWEDDKTKVYSGTYAETSFAQHCFNDLLKTLDSMKDALNERYVSYTALSGVEECFRKIDHCTNRIDKWFKEGKIYGNNDVEIFMDAFSQYTDELFEMIREIDKDWE